MATTGASRAPSPIRARLEAAADDLEAILPDLDVGGVTCERCGVAARTDIMQYRAHEQIEAMVRKLRGFAKRMP